MVTTSRRDGSCVKSARVTKIMKPNATKSSGPESEERESIAEQRESSGDERCIETCERDAADIDDGPSSAHKRKGSGGEHQKSHQALTTADAAISFDASQPFNFPSLGTSSFGNMSFAGVGAAPSNGLNNVDMGEPFTNMSMSQDQAWEILNQDSFGFNLGQGTLSLSFSNDCDENLILPYPDNRGTRVNELKMENALDGTSDDLKKSVDLTSAVTESLDGPGTPSKMVFDDGGVKRSPFLPHDFDGMGLIPPTPPSTQSAPMASSLPPRKREPRYDRHRSRRIQRSSRDDVRDYDRYSHSFGQSKSEEYYYERPRHQLRSTGGKRSGTRSSSRRYRSHQTKPYHRSGERLVSGSPPPLPNMGSAPSPRNHSSERESRNTGEESRAVASHPWHPGHIRPNPRYPQSPSNANPSPRVRSQAGAPPTHMMSHQGFASQMAPHGYPYYSPASHQNTKNHLPHSGGNNGEPAHRAFLPPPPPQFTNTKTESNSNLPPREVFILSSSKSNNGCSETLSRSQHHHPDHNAPPPLLPPLARGPYPVYPPTRLHPQNVPGGHAQAARPPLQGTLLLGPLTREQAPGIGWPADEDALLTECMANHKSPIDWEVIAREHGRSRTARECHDRWTRYLKPGARKGQWREEEDAIVLRAIAQSAEMTFTQWADLSPQLPGRSGKQIRDRWVNYLNPAINHLPFSREDDLRLWEGHKKLGKRWVEISVKVFNSTRSENHIKNRWYSAAFKKFIANEYGPNAYVDAKAGE